MGYPDTPWQQGDILKSEELNAMVPGLSPIGTVVPWALPFAEQGGAVYSNVARFAPFHLPATGGVYANSVAPLLAGAIGHTFVDGEPDVGDDGDLISGAALNKHHGTGYDNGAIYRRDGDDGPAVLVLADAFCTPDMRGRSPIGAASGFGIPQAPVRDVEFGERVGDWRVPYHRHYLPGTGTGGGWPAILYHDSTADINYVGGGMTGNPRPDSIDANGMGSNTHPSTVINFLIFAGERISDPTPVTGTGDARSGEPVRMHPVTTASMIRKRLANPNLSDEEREMLEAHLNGDPWPPPDPPDTRTATKTTRKTTTRKRKKS